MSQKTPQFLKTVKYVSAYKLTKICCKAMTLKINTYILTKTPISVHKGTDITEGTKTVQQVKSRN